MKVIFYYLVVDGIVNLVAIALADNDIHNLPLLHVFTIMEFLMLSYFYLQVLRDKTARLVLRCLLIIFPLFCIVNFLFFQSINRFNTNTRPIEALIIMACSLAYFSETNDTATKWSQIPVNWVNTGLLLYFSGALFIFSFSNVTENFMSKKYHAIYFLMWNVHATLVLSMYLLIAIGFSKCRKL
jgi:hypothetical protein